VLPLFAPVVALGVADAAGLEVGVDDGVEVLVVPDELEDEDASLDKALARVVSSVATVF
jgi:hypothetical protein